MTTGQMEILLRKQPDVTQAQNGSSDPKLAVREVLRVYEPDDRGLTEVLYRNSEGEAMTAFMRGRTLAYVVDGF